MGPTVTQSQLRRMAQGKLGWVPEENAREDVTVAARCYGCAYASCHSIRTFPSVSPISAK